MKRLSILFALSFVLLSFGLAYAVDFGVIVDPSYVWDNGGTPTIFANTNVEIQIQWGNAVAAFFLGGNFNQRIYGTGDVTAWTYYGGNVAGGILPGWQDLWGSQWEAGNFYYADSWDGSGADTMAHSILSFAGWPGGQPMATKYKVLVNIPMADISQTGTICLDSTGHDNTDRTWLFPSEEEPNYGGPYCFAVGMVPDQPPVFVGPPTQLTTAHHVAFDVTIPVSDPDGDDITGAAASKGTATLIGGAGGSGQVHWVYDPPCSEVGTSNSVTLTVSNAMNGTAVIDLVVTNQAPVIAGDCGVPEKVVGVNASTTFNFTATDPNGGADTKTWSVVPEDIDGHHASIVNGVLTITTGPSDAPVPPFVVTVTDCADATSSCQVSIDVVGQLPFGIKIEKDEGPSGFGVYQGHHAYVDVIKTAGTENILGFDFLIAYDNSALSFMGALAGELFDMAGDYEWEYFTYRFGPDGNCDGGCPSGLLRVVGIADQNDGPHHPESVDVPDGMVLFTLDFLVTNDRTLECMFLPISFFWLDCGDNSLAMNYKTEDPLSVRQAISLDVFGYNGTLEGYLIPLPDAFPSYGGAIADCMVPADPQHPEKVPTRFIHFYNGGVDIACAAEIDARGDVNLNGVSNEIADAVVLTNYFLYGFAAFTVNVEGQTAASDVNADGVPLSVADLVYLIRVVVGDAQAYPKLSPAAEPVTFGYSGDVITADVELGAAAFVLEGNVPVSLGNDAAHMSIKSAFDGQNTRVIVYSFDKGATFSGQILNTTGSIVSVEAAMYDGTPLKTVNLPTAFAVRNYPNPFNPQTTIEMALPVASNWTLSVYNMLGQKVKDFSGYSEAGIQKVTFDASTLASGIYFYKFAANNSEITKKMVLLK